jgi:hypothetical protein
MMPAIPYTADSDDFFAGRLEGIDDEGGATKR